MDNVSQVREKIDIVTLISEYLPLKRMGRNFKVPCPFHNEKTPSFVVSPERQIWHCFGCSKGGDAFTFLMEYENLEFPEALRILAKRAGIVLTTSHFESGTASKKEKFYALNRLACEFYHYVLTSLPAGTSALSYVTDVRKIHEKVIQTFLLGYSPKTGNALIRYLITKKGYKKEDLLDCGLATYREGRIADFFVNRIMFPLFDHRDNILGFSGRVMDASTHAKYINTKETIIYQKGHVFFGLNTAKQEIKKENNAIIMEGEFDVISSIQEGITNAIAIKGTALTKEQAHLIARFTQKVSLCFDQDAPGREAMKRSVPSLEKEGLTTTVILTPGGKDPDASIKTNPALFKKAVRESIGVYDYLLEETIQMYGTKTVEGKKKISDELLPLVGNIENEIVKEHYIRKLADVLGTTYESIVKQGNKLWQKNLPKTQQVSVKDKKSREEMLETYVLALVLQHNNPKAVLDRLNPLDGENYVFKTPAFKKIIATLRTYFSSTDTFDNKRFLHQLPEELIPAFDTTYLFPLQPIGDINEYNQEIDKAVKELQLLFIKSRIKKIGEEIKQKEITDENAQLSILHEEFSKLTNLLQQLAKV